MDYIPIYSDEKRGGLILKEDTIDNTLKIKYIITPKQLDGCM